LGRTHFIVQSREYPIGRDAPCAERVFPTSVADAERSGRLVAYAEQFAFSADAAGVPWLPEAEPSAAKR